MGEVVVMVARRSAHCATERYLGRSRFMYERRYWLVSIWRELVLVVHVHQGCGLS